VIDILASNEKTKRWTCRFASSLTFSHFLSSIKPFLKESERGDFNHLKRVSSNPVSFLHRLFRLGTFVFPLQTTVAQQILSNMSLELDAIDSKNLSPEEFIKKSNQRQMKK